MHKLTNFEREIIVTGLGQIAALAEHLTSEVKTATGVVSPDIVKRFNRMYQYSRNLNSDIKALEIFEETNPQIEKKEKAT